MLLNPLSSSSTYFPSRTYSLLCQLYVIFFGCGIRSIGVRDAQYTAGLYRQYRCSDQPDHHRPSKPQYHLCDLDQRNIRSVPPSTPKCSIDGSKFVGHNVTLTCHSSSGKPVPTYTWQRISPKPQSFNFPIHNSQMGTLILRNLTKEMSGLYTCSSINLAGNASCSIQMEVITSNNAWVIAGAVIGALLGICLLVAIIIFCCTYRSKRAPEKEENLANEIKEDAQSPVGNVWIKNDLISKNGTLSSANSTMRSYKPYPNKPPSYAASTITALDAGSTGSCNQPKHPQKSDYAMTVNSHRSSPSARDNRAQLQAPKQEPALPSMTSSNLARMGAVPVMVPAQSQVGSLV
ncbi:endothelial cell-selective adhesion molecule-like isoform X3 [Mobula birostris]|uniref:endothelial cell-selective adhesion molecule-like isoform X3 n=1 Tax=Mobula birostris TaxID=1983395 RepID=UPI003B27D76D